MDFKWPSHPFRIIYFCVNSYGHYGIQALHQSIVSDGAGHSSSTDQRLQLGILVYLICPATVVCARDCLNMQDTGING